MNTPTRDIVFFDGECGVCSWLVQWILDNDDAGRFTFAPLQGATAAATATRHAAFPTDVETMAFLSDAGGTERLWLRSAAILRICARLPWPWRGALILWLLPRPLTDLAYRAFARLRHRVSAPACRMPTPEDLARVLP